MNQLILDSEHLSKSISYIADAILKRHPFLKDVVLIGILDYGFCLTQRLAFVLNKKTNHTVPIGQLDVTLYRDDLPRSSYISIKESDIPFSINKKHLILVNDVLATGKTIRSALNMLADYGAPDTIELAVLIEKGDRKIPVFANYVAKKMAYLGEKDYLKFNLVEIDGEDQVILKKESIHESSQH